MRVTLPLHYYITSSVGNVKLYAYAYFFGREEVLHLKHQLIVAADKRENLVDSHQKALDTTRQEKVD